MRTGPCRGCGAQMIWAVTITGTNQPFDPEPDPEKGNRILVKRGEDAPLALALSNLTEPAREAAERNGVALYTPHHATCPAREQFQKAAA